MSKSIKIYLNVEVYPSQETPGMYDLMYEYVTKANPECMVKGIVTASREDALKKLQEFDAAGVPVHPEDVAFLAMQQPK